MEDDVLKMTAVFCLECNNVLEVLSGDQKLLYTDKRCECGSMGFYTTLLKIRCIFEKPIGRTPFYEEDGESWYIKE